MEDEAILASVDRDPDAFATFYRRHAGRVLEYLVGYTQDERLAAELCAETFAVALRGAHRFDPEHGDAAAWLDGISRRLLARAERRGAPDDRARRRLGMASLEPGGSFVQELEEELVAAARYLASRRRPLPRPRLPPVPRPPARSVRAALAGVAALVALTAVAALALGGRDDPPQTPAATSGPSARLVALLSPERCFGRAAGERPATPAMPYFSVFRYRQGVDDQLGDLGDSLPVATFHPAETRLAANGRRGTRLHLVASLGVSADGGCAADDGPGVCLVAEDGGRFRCFTLGAIRDGLAFVRTDRGSIAGVVPDGVGRVTLSAGGQRASGRVADNVYEAELDVPPGTPVGVDLERPGENACAREVAPGLLGRVAALRRPPGERLLPTGALSRLREDERVAAVVERGARFWGAESGVEFWVVPIVPRSKPDCAPANRVCIVAVPDGVRAEAHCLFEREWNFEGWRIAPLYAGNAVVFAIVGDRATGARVTIGNQSALVGAKGNVLAGLLPFPHDEIALKSVEPTFAADAAKPSVAVIDATGDPEARLGKWALRLLGEAGYPTVDMIARGVEAQMPTVLYWRPGEAPDLEIGRVARLVGADSVQRIDERTPLHARGTDAPIVVVAGQRFPGDG